GAPALRKRRVLTPWPPLPSGEGERGVGMWFPLSASRRGGQGVRTKGMAARWSGGEDQRHRGEGVRGGEEQKAWRRGGSGGEDRHRRTYAPLHAGRCRAIITPSAPPHLPCHAPAARRQARPRGHS